MAQNKQQSKQKTAQSPSTPHIEARIDRILDGGGKTKAFASATIAGTYAIHGIRVIDTEKGIFIAMPQESYTKNGEKRYSDTFHAITAEGRTALVEAVDAAYARKLEELESQQEEAEEAPEPGMEMSM